MKKLIMLFAIALFVAQPLFAQSSIGIFAGYGQSNFDFSEDENFSQAGYVPVGVQFLMGVGTFQLGAEIDYSAVPFGFEVSSTYNGVEHKIADTKVTQLYYGLLAKWRVGTKAGFNPYLRAGAGLYTGDYKVEYSDEMKQAYSSLEDETYKYKSAFGFNVGVGVNVDVATNTGVFIEAVYHKVKRQLDLEGSEAEGHDNYAIHAGVNFGL